MTGKQILAVCALTALWCGSQCASAATPQSAREAITVDDLRRHAAFLASDTLEGRAAGTRGGQAAAAYLQSEFRKFGLQGGGDDGGYVQEFGRGYRNLLAVLPGSDPVLREETIIVCAHFDHVGYGNSSNSAGPYGYIHNGADDNASGASALLEVAQAFAELDIAPRRTILFALWDAEEDGLLGSYHWTRQPTRPLGGVRLVINVDMCGRLRDAGLSVYGVRSMNGMRQLVTRANGNSDLKLDFDWTNRDDSDHWPFLQKRVPYLMLHTGDHPDYHRPSDDIDKLNLPGMQQVAMLMFEVARSAADASDLAPFRTACLQEGRSQQLASERPSPPLPRLGIVWQTSRKPGEPFLIERVYAGSPAANAGLRPGDTLHSLDGQPADQIVDLARHVHAATSPLVITVNRPGHSTPLSFEVHLRGNPVHVGLTWREDATEPGVAIVTGVVAGSPAALAGLQVNDRVLRPDDETPRDINWLAQFADGHPEEATLQIERGGRLLDRRLTTNPATEE